MRFSASEAAFEGFRLVRRAPLSLVFWALAYIVYLVVIFALIGGPMLAVMAQFQSLAEAGVTDPTPEQMGPILAAYMAILPMALPLGLLFSAIMSAAVARGVLRPEEKAFGYLRIGMDEVRVLAVTFVLGVLAFAVYMGMALAAGLLGGAIGLASGGDTRAIGPLAIVIGLVVAGVMIWLFARFSLAVPITVAERRIAIFDSFRVTRGKALPIIGMAIIAGIMSIIVTLLGMLVCLPIIFAIGGFSRLTEMAGAAPMEILQAAGPVLIVFLLVQALLGALQLAIVYAPFSAAYRDLTAGREGTTSGA